MEPEAQQNVDEPDAPIPEEAGAEVAAEDLGAHPSGTGEAGNGVGEDWEDSEETAEGATLDEQEGGGYGDDDIDGERADNEDAAAPEGSGHTNQGKEVLDSIAIETGNIAGSGHTIIGQINASLKGEPFLDELDENTIQHLKDVFESPEGFDDLVTEFKRRDARIVVVHGSENSGKLTCAVNLAWKLWGTDDRPPEVYIYKRYSDETKSLSEVIQSKIVRSGSVLILEDVFEKKVDRHELEPPELNDLTEALAEKESFLVVTTQIEDLRWFLAASLNAEATDLKGVLKKHLEYVQEHNKWSPGEGFISQVANQWSMLQQWLHNPAQIEWFCLRLAKLGASKVEEIELIARQAAAAGREALKEWFRHLRSNEKLLAMLTFLCGGSDREFLETIYTKAVCSLRTDGLSWLVDIRKIGFEDMLEAVQARDLEGRIEFKDSSFEAEAGIQTQNWAYLLWSVLRPLVAEVKPVEEWETWQARKGLGMALGRMSPHSGKNFSQCLDQLAGQGWDKAAVVAGYALEEAVRRDMRSQARPAAEKILSWIGSGNPPLMWAGGAALPRVYSATIGLTADDRYASAASTLQKALLFFLEQLVLGSQRFNEETLRELERKATQIVERQDREGKKAKGKPKTLDDVITHEKRRLGWGNRRCAIRSAQKIFLMDSRRSLILGEWLQNKSDFLREVAKGAIEEIFKALTKPHYKPGEAKHAPFLDLINPVLGATGAGKNDRSLVDQIFLALKSWLHWTSWREPIFKTLLTIANRGSHEVRGKLRAALSRLWMSGGNAERDVAARKIAQAVIVRSYVMEGVLMDQPSFGRGAFVLDPAFLTGDAETRRRKEDGCRYLLGLLAAQVDASFVHLGSIEPVRVDDEKAVTLAAEHPVPRLLIPAVEAAGVENLRLVLLLSGGAVQDLEDALGEPWGSTLLQIAVGEDVELCAGVEMIAIGKELGPQQIAQIEKTLQARWARALALAGPSAWVEALKSFRIWGELERSPRTWLEERVKGLDDTNQALGPEDLARKLLCALGWYAAFDLRSCAGLLREWLSRPEEGDGCLVRHWMGAAGAKALFRIYGEHHSAFGTLAPQILFEELAHPLAAQGSDGVESVLRAVRKWLEEPVGAAYLAGGVVEGRGRLLRWAEEFVPRQVEALAASLPEAPEQPVVDVAADPYAAAAAMLDRMRLQFALGRPKVLPKLGAGESYGLIVLDASRPGMESLETLAGKLFESLNRDGRRIKPIIYRLGERQPAWLAGDPAPPLSVLVPAGNRPPRLLGPILSDSGLSPSGLSPDTVRFLLVLSAQPPLDVEDWIETDWRDRIVFYEPGSDADRKPGFAALPALNGGNPASAIARFLLRRLGGEILEGFGIPAVETSDPAPGAPAAG